jgi:PAS domain S-box-containing protein
MSTTPPTNSPENRLDIVDAELKEERCRARQYMDITGVMLMALNEKGEIAQINKKCSEILGFSEAELLGKNWFRHCLPDNAAEGIRGLFERLMAGQVADTEEVEHEITTKDNGIRIIAWHYTALKNANDQIIGVLSSGEDVTERRQNEKTRISLQVMLSNAYEMTRMSHWEYDAINGVFLFNDQFYRLFRTTVEEVGGYAMSPARYIDYFVHPDDRPKVHNAVQSATETMDENYSRKLEHRAVFADGTLGYMSIHFTVYKDADGHTVRAFGVNKDITELKRAEWERLSNLHFFESMDNVNRAMQRAQDLDSMLSDVLDSVLGIFDCDRAFLCFPLNRSETTWQVPVQRCRYEYPPVFKTNVPIDLTPEEIEFSRAILDSPGAVYMGPDSAFRISNETWERHGFHSQLMTALRPKVGEPWGFGMHQCSHTRIWTEEEKKLFQEIGYRLEDGLTSFLVFRDLKNNEEFLNAVVENIPNAIIVKDAETLKYVRFNKAASRLLGAEEKDLQGKTVYEIFSKQDADDYTEKDRMALDGKTMVDIPMHTIGLNENDARRLHTRKIPILDENGRSQYLLVISEDITEQKKLESQLMQAQKLESIGSLAGGIAHDFNNMLGVILGHTEIALGQLQPKGMLYGILQKIYNAANRSADLTRQLLAFARKQTVAPKVLDLNVVVEGMLVMMERLLGEDLDLAWLPESKPVLVKMDPSQIDQILANLCVNARDAIFGVGKVTIETGHVSFDEEYCADHIGFLPGHYVLLAVSDNGCGMDSEIRNRIFEPFFTTKQVGKGTGLGLSTIYGIVKQNNGFINVYSEPGHGTIFKIYLPQHTAKFEIAAPKKTTPETVTGNETILVLEDELSILEITKLMLEKLRYAVFSASTPSEAIRVAKEQSGKIHLLITDVTMPEMNGLELAKRIIDVSPGIKCMFMSGYTSNVIGKHGVLDENVHYIQKPFSIQDLAAKVRETLESDDQLNQSLSNDGDNQ